MQAAESSARGGQVTPEADKLGQRRRDICGDSCRENNHM